MINDALSLCRSLLFLSASNPRAIEKARTLGADMVILDLEDAVKPADKEAVDRAMEITDIRLEEKSGGRSGRFVRNDKVTG